MWAAWRRIRPEPAQRTTWTPSRRRRRRRALAAQASGWMWVPHGQGAADPGGGRHCRQRRCPLRDLAGTPGVPGCGQAEGRSDILNPWHLKPRERIKAGGESQAELPAPPGALKAWKGSSTPTPHQQREAGRGRGPPCRSHRPVRTAWAQVGKQRLDPKGRRWQILGAGDSQRPPRPGAGGRVLSSRSDQFVVVVWVFGSNI